MMNIIISEEILDTIWTFLESCALGCKRKVGKAWLYHHCNHLLLVWFWLWSIQILVSVKAIPCPQSFLFSSLFLYPVMSLSLHQSTRGSATSVRFAYNYPWGHVIAWRQIRSERISLFSWLREKNGNFCDTNIHVSQKWK